MYPYSPLLLSLILSLDKTFLEVYTNIQEINFQNHSEFWEDFDSTADITFLLLT